MGGAPEARGTLQLTMGSPVHSSIPLVDLRRQYAQHHEEWNDRVNRVLSSGRYIGGDEVSGFEGEFAAYLGTKFGVAVGSGSDALFLGLSALGIGPGDEVATVSQTFVSTVDAIRRVGGNPVFIDISRDSPTMDPECLRKRMSPQVKAILPVHLYGDPCDLGQIVDIAEHWGVPIVEDAAQAAGATFGSRKCGSIGRIGCFSFYPSKNLGAAGDGGFIATSDEKLLNRLRLLREYGQREKYVHIIQGYNSRLDSLQAAILRMKLKHLDDWNNARRRIARAYTKAFSEEPSIVLPVNHLDRTQVFHVFPIMTVRRDKLRSYLGSKGIETGIHYPIPVHKQLIYRTMSRDSFPLPETERVSDTELSLPIFPELLSSEVDRVIESVLDWRQASDE
jgi:dTDP-4-amino-4,6-dideoxygalactose transaminase